MDIDTLVQQVGFSVIYEDVSIRADKPSYYEIECPECRHPSKNAFIYKDTLSGHCNRTGNCRAAFSPFKYFCSSRGLSDYKEGYKELLRIAGYDVKEYSGDLSAYSSSMKRRHIIESIVDYGKKLLYEDSRAKECLSYLENTRKFALEPLKKTDIGFYPTVKEVRAHLSAEGYSEDDIQASGVVAQKFEADYKLFFPFRDRYGNPTGIVARSLKEKLTDGEQRWNSSYGTTKKEPFGLSAARNEKDLFLVEGYPDALYMQALGYKNIIAIGAGKLSRDHLDAILEKTPNSLTLVLDNDSAGFENTKDAIRLIQKYKKKDARALKTSFFVVPPTVWGECDDPDSYRNAHGIEETIQTLQTKRVNADKWLISELLEGYECGDDFSQDAAYKNAIEYLEDSPSGEGYHDCIEAISDITKKPLDIISESIDTWRELKRKDEAEKQYKELLLKASKGVLNRDSLIKELRSIHSDYAPPIPLKEYISEKKKKDEERTGEFLGYKLERFKGLCSKISGVQPGYYLIAGEANVGKTAFLANIFLDILSSNPETHGIYFSLDDNKDVILNRFLATLSSIEINKVQNPKKINRYDDEGYSLKAQERLNRAYDTLLSFSDERLSLYDISEINDVDALEACVQSKVRESENVFIAVDGLYNLSVGEDREGLRGENIERANRLKALVDTFSIPVLCTGELRKKSKTESVDKEPSLHDLMETSKFSYNANLVLLLFSKDTEKEDDDITVYCKYAKNKLSWYRGVEELVFKRKLSTLDEPHQEAIRSAGFTGGF